mmetsp:Transcript_16225/g.44079  ORF Transcript_16225/g.44079 Transcript_16225/m.44079 type:complete len:95 (+) Transcript_16225:972-1256(+)
MACGPGTTLRLEGSRLRVTAVPQGLWYSARCSRWPGQCSKESDQLEVHWGTCRIPLASPAEYGLLEGGGMPTLTANAHVERLLRALNATAFWLS